MTRSPASFDDDGETIVFRIALDDPQKLKRKWPPSSIPIFLFAVPLFLYPLWVVICAKYRDESDHIRKPLSFVLDGIAAWVLDYMPGVMANFLVLHLVCCVSLWLWN